MIKPGHYKVFPLAVEATSPHSYRMDYEVLEGECKGEIISMHVDAIHELEVSWYLSGGPQNKRTTYGEMEEDLLPSERRDVSALRVGELVYLRTFTVKRIS